MATHSHSSPFGFEQADGMSLAAYLREEFFKAGDAITHEAQERDLRVNGSARDPYLLRRTAAGIPFGLMCAKFPTFSKLFGIKRIFTTMTTTTGDEVAKRMLVQGISPRHLAEMMPESIRTPAGLTYAQEHHLNGYAEILRRTLSRE